MKIKQFLKPNWRKIVIFVVLLGLSFLYVNIQGLEFANYIEYRGLPLPSLVRFVVDFHAGTELLYFNLFIDIVFWYLLSCLIVWIYDKVKKK